MYHLRKDTLAGLKTSALFLKRNFYAQPLPDAVEQLNRYMNGEGQNHVKPEAEAFKFYFANHAFSLLNQRYELHEPMSEDVALVGRDYVKMASDLTARLAYYCLMITVREARHLNNPTGSMMNTVESKYGKDVRKFLAGNTGHGEGSAVSNLRNHAPKVALGDLVGGLVHVFNHGSWNGGYGGPKWGQVAATLLSMIKGETSPEMFADTAFTLAHNNGPIFNKGMLYSGYTHFIYKLLDVQRSGQVPQLYCDGLAGFKVGSEVQNYVSAAQAALGDELRGYVDWYKVEALGALHKYSQEKKDQTAKWGISKWAKESEVKKLIAEERAAKKAAAEKALAEKYKKYWITPNLSVIAGTRVEVAEALKEAA